MSAETSEETLFEKIERLRDEIQLKIHLGKAEARDVWDDLEGKWDGLQKNRHKIEKAGAESASELKAAGGLVLDELVEGYERIRKAL